MPDLTPTNQQAAGELGGVVTSQQPHSSVSADQVAQPYRELGNALNASGDALGTIAEESAKVAGFNAVTRDAQGNIQVEKMPIVGPASQAFARSVKFAALANGEADAKDQDIALRRRFPNDPQGYLTAANAFKDEKVKQYTDFAGPELGLTLGKTIDATTTQSYKGLQAEHQRLTVESDKARITDGLNESRGDILALAHGGDISSPAQQQIVDKYKTLLGEKVANPLLGYPPEAAAYDTQKLLGDIHGNKRLYDINQIYNDKSFDAYGNPNGGAAKAMEAAKSLLTDTDPSWKMTPTQRQAYYGHAIAEIRSNEAARAGALRDLQADHAELNEDIASGSKDPAIPSRVQDLIDRARSLNNRAMAARLSSEYIKKDFYDAFGQQPMEDRTQQLNDLQGVMRQKGAYNFFIDKGWTPEQAAGIVGGLRGETAGLNPMKVHDGGMGIGISGWNGARRAQLSQFAAANNVSPRDLKTQLEFVNYELNNSEKAAGDKLRAAQTPEDAGQASLSYFRPANYDTPGAHPERAQYARQAFNAFADGAPLAPTDVPGPGVNPASQIWLQAHRMRQLSSDARDQWTQIKKDWTTEGAVPSASRVDTVTNAMRAAGDFDGLSTVGHDQQMFDLVQQGAQLPNDARHSLIEEYKRRAASGQMNPGDSDILKGLTRRDDIINKGLAENPIATTVTNLPGLRTPAPLDLTSPQSLAAGLQMRAQIAQRAADNWKIAPPSALDKADLHQVQAALDTPDPAVKGAIFQAIATLPEQVRNATLAKIGEKRPDFMVQAAAGSMMRDASEVAQSILRGQQAIKADKGFLPTGRGEAAPFAQELEKRLPAAAFSLAGRTTDNGPFEVARGMVKARYADLSAQAADTSGKTNNERLQQAVEDVTGGILSHNGSTLIAPARGMKQGQFDGVLDGINENDMAGVTTLNGAAVSPDYLRNSAQLESIGSGRYLVRLGKDPSRPVYAYQNANTEAPQKFVLDLRNRKPGASNYAAPDYGSGGVGLN